MDEKSEFKKKFDDLYSLLQNENLVIQAYGNIKRNNGSLTLGVNSQTILSIDKMSLNKIKNLAKELKSGTYKFSRLTRKWIPKKNMHLSK